MIKSVMRKFKLGKEERDLAYWLQQDPEKRLATVEHLRQEFHHDHQQGFQRVYRIVKRP